MLFDMSVLSPQDRYKVLAASIVPRPIAWITTMSRAGVVNAAPFSFFNMMGNDPPTVAVGLMPRDEKLKDTAANILETGEFVINLVSEANAEAMNLTCIDAPSDIDELAMAGLTAEASHAIKRAVTSLVMGPLQTIVIGQVACAHVDDRFVEDAGRCYIATKELKLIARMHGSGGYIRTRDTFELDRPSWAVDGARISADSNLAST
jgi:flavin reductase (DIM6/NTAB) family NADH-FMN oxidoreductase RutF